MIYAKHLLLGSVALAATVTAANSHAKALSQSEALAPGYQLVRGADQQLHAAPAAAPAHPKLNIHVPTQAELVAAGIETDGDSEQALSGNSLNFITSEQAIKAKPIPSQIQPQETQSLASDVIKKDAKASVADDSKSKDSEPLASKTQDEKADSAKSDEATFVQKGVSSWYGKQFAGRKTASGEIFDPQELTAAHKELPLGSVIRVSYPHTGKSVVVRVTDRGPYHGNRILDLSYAAAKKIGMVNAGKGKVKIELISKKGGKAKKAKKTTF